MRDREGYRRASGGVAVAVALYLMLGAGLPEPGFAAGTSQTATDRTSRRDLSRERLV